MTRTTTKLQFTLAAVALSLGACSSGDSGVQYITEDAVRSMLKDPNSAQFDGVYTRQGAGSAADTVETYVCGRVNAKNSFGGYTGYKRFIGHRIKNLKTGQIAEAWVGLEAGGPPFSEAIWNEHCEFGKLPKV